VEHCSCWPKIAAPSFGLEFVRDGRQAVGGSDRVVLELVQQRLVGGDFLLLLLLIAALELESESSCGHSRSHSAHGGQWLPVLDDALDDLLGGHVALAVQHAEGLAALRLSVGVGAGARRGLHRRAPVAHQHHVEEVEHVGAHLVRRPDHHLAHVLERTKSRQSHHFLTKNPIEVIIVTFYKKQITQLLNTKIALCSDTDGPPSWININS